MIDLSPFFLINPQPRTDRHRLAGTFTVDDVPAQGRIFVFKRDNWSMIATTLSHPVTGKWTLQGMQEHPERSLVVIAMIDDSTGDFNAEIADFVTQVAPE